MHKDVELVCSILDRVYKGEYTHEDLLNSLSEFYGLGLTDFDPMCLDMYMGYIHSDMWMAEKEEDKEWFLKLKQKERALYVIRSVI